METTKDTFRAFWAVDFSEEVKDQLLELMARLREKYSKEFEQVRWTKRENLHITLRFLGNITVAQYQAMTEKITQQLHKKPPNVKAKPELTNIHKALTYQNTFVTIHSSWTI